MEIGPTSLYTQKAVIQCPTSNDGFNSNVHEIQMIKIPAIRFTVPLAGLWMSLSQIDW